MEDKPQGSGMKRPLSDDFDFSNKPPPQKKVRFPKGKKVKHEEEPVTTSAAEPDPDDLTDPRVAAKERAKRRSQMTAQLFTEDNREGFHDISIAEVDYEDNENFLDDGIPIEPFNLNKEREEGYFDAAGNFVEYAHESEIKDAWLDSVDVDTNFAERSSVVLNNADEAPDLSSEEIGKMKRRIADLLEPGETVLQALRRLKGTSNSRKEKMAKETKILFDQLTEDSMKLMENDVYHEKQEVFEREAGYERLARARGGSLSTSEHDGIYDRSTEESLYGGVGTGAFSLVFSDATTGPSNPSATSAEVPTDNTGDGFDMFAEDDENAPNPSSNGVSAPSVNRDSENTQGDYVYDESSGYSFNEATGTYEEVKDTVPNGEPNGTAH
ncbi:hypothetical protein RJ641_013268 [Dillenia turbinata]|uniref:CD2 antigen cytoplasmic tail-binding protein 2 n=1 Tax=Dillenia turbinata TaxID=194707 RepID=A0AAN8W9P5_9MAGN